jgi:hypothetical protein
MGERGRREREASVVDQRGKGKETVWHQSSAKVQSHGHGVASGWPELSAWPQASRCPPYLFVQIAALASIWPAHCVSMVGPFLVHIHFAHSSKPIILSLANTQLN